MKRTLKWVIGIVVGAGIVALLVFAFIEGRDEIEREREREEPIKVPPRISRTSEGVLIVTIDAETQTRIGLKTAVLEAGTVYPEVVAYGRLQEDPGESFVVRAPIAGVLHASSAAAWPAIGQSLGDGTAIGSIEPRITPVEQSDLAVRRLDLQTRLSDARADVEGAEARANAARMAFERARTLNADNKNVSDRAVQEAESLLKSEEARLAAARRNAAAIEAALAAPPATAASAAVSLARGGEVVEVLARPGETVEGGQPILRVSRFGTLLARVDVPAGERIDPNVTSARIVVAGHEDRPLNGQRVSFAPSVDPATLGEGFVFRLPGAPLIRPGAGVTAYLRAPGAAQKAVTVPESAVVRSGGMTWVYRQLADDQFSRLEIPVDRFVAAGFLVPRGLNPGERIVVQGAQLLLSEEQKSQIQILEETESK